MFESFLHLQCLHGVCIGWARALWLQRLFYVDSKGDVKEFFGLRFGRFSSRVQMVFGSFCICSARWCLHRLGMCSVAPKLFLCGSRWCLHRLGMCSVAPKIVLVLCGFQRSRERVFWLAVWAVFGSCPDGGWVFLHLQCPECLHRLGMCSVAPKIVFVLCGFQR